MNGTILRQDDKYGGELSPEQREKILELIANLFAAEEPVTVSETFDQLLSPDILQYLQERLKDVQTSDEDISAILLEVALSLLQDAQMLGIDVVVARYLDERQRVIDALGLLEAATESEEFYRVLEERQQILLSDLALAFLSGMYYESLDIEGDVVAAGSLKQHIDLIKDARVSSVPAAWERSLADNQRVIDALDLLEEQTTYETFYRMLQEKREILITEKAIWFLQSHVAALRQQGDPMADHYEAHAFLIKDAYTRNLADAWEDYTGVDRVVQVLQETDEPEEILKLMQKHEKVLRSEAALFVLRSYIARAKASGKQDAVHYFERWFRLLEDAHHSGITAAWRKFYNDLIVQIYGQMASSATQSIHGYNTELSRLVPGTLEWADMLSNRGFAYFSSTIGSHGDRANLELAIADFSAALTVYGKYGRQDRYAETLEYLGTARLLSLYLNQDQEVDLARAAADLMVVLVGTREDSYTAFHDPLQYRQQAIDNFTMALALYKQQGRQAEWVRMLLKRAAVYRIGNVGNAEDTLLAIDDYSAALTMLKKETSPSEWMGAIGNRGTCYLQIGGNGYEKRLNKAIADLEAALSVCTRQSSPALYRKMQLFRYQAFERLGKWEEAYQAIREAIAVQHDLLAMNPVESSRMSLIADVAGVQVEIYVRAAQVLLHFNRPPLKEIACLLEEGRTQNLRLALSLDTLDPEQIPDPAASRRAERFLAALKTWREHQNEMSGLFTPSGMISSPGASQKQGQPAQQAQEDHAAFHKAVEAIRKHDDADFMTPTPIFDDILRAVSTPNTALVYLATGAESGLALLISRNDRGMQQMQYIPLPRLKTRTISDLIETDTTKYMPIKLERSLSALGELGLDDVAQALNWNGVQRVRIVPFGLLGLFPLPAVQVHSSLGGKKRLGDLFEVTIAPSARALELAEKRAAHLDSVTRPYLLLGGDPHPRPRGARKLPFAQAEADTARKIAECFGYEKKNIRYLPSREVTKENAVEVLKHAWYAHLAVHGIYQPDNPRRTRLLLAGTEHLPEEKRCIFLSETLERKTADGRDTLNLEGMRLLVLSACETAIIDVRQVPDEVIGLAAGFLQAGVAGVIASLWAVDDLATYLLMSRFTRLYLDPWRAWTPAHALAEAQRWLREEATNKVLMTYDPLQEILTDPRYVHAQQGTAETPTEKKRASFTSELRGLHLSHESGLANVRSRAAMQKPNKLPYADPIYWAGFVVTGC